MHNIIPFLWFDDTAEEAMHFYVSVFKDSKIVNIQRYPEGMTEEHMKGMGGKVLTGEFELRGQRFMALDGGPIFKPTEAVSFLVECTTQDEIDHYWDALSAVPASEQCGWLKDKYGFSWQIVPDMSRWLNDPDTAKSARAIQAMLKMKKIIIADLERAYEQG